MWGLALIWSHYYCVYKLGCIHNKGTSINIQSYHIFISDAQLLHFLRDTDTVPTRAFFFF